MLAPLADGLLHALEVEGTRTARILREPAIGQIIPDLLVGSWDPARRPVAYGAATRIDAHIWALLERDGPHTLGDLTARLHLSMSRANDSLARLTRAGIVTVTPYAQFAISMSARADDFEIIAVEAKLARWQEAIQQAVSYLTFANRSLVVLDGNRVEDTAGLRDAARTSGVGLVLQHGRFLRTIIAAPRWPREPTVSGITARIKLVTTRGGRAFRHRDGRHYAHNL